MGEKVSLDANAVEALDKIATKYNVSRSDAVRLLAAAKQDLDQLLREHQRRRGLDVG